MMISITSISDAVTVDGDVATTNLRNRSHELRVVNF